MAGRKSCNECNRDLGTGFPTYFHKGYAICANCFKDGQASHYHAWLFTSETKAERYPTRFANRMTANRFVRDKGRGGFTRKCDCRVH